MEFLKLYFKHLGLYDYIGLGVVGTVFLLLFILSLILLFKKPFLGFVFFVLSLMVLPFGVYGVQTLLNKTVRKSEFQIIKLKPLHFSKSLLIEAKIKNLSKTNFKMCLIRLKIIKKSNSKLKRFLYTLKPLAIKTIYIQESIQKGSSYTLKKILDSVIYSNSDEMTAKMDCY